MGRFPLQKRTIEMFWHQEGSLKAVMSLYQFHSTDIIITATTNSLLNEKLPGHLHLCRTWWLKKQTICILVTCKGFGGTGYPTTEGKRNMLTREVSTPGWTTCILQLNSRLQRHGLGPALELCVWTLVNTKFIHVLKAWRVYYCQLLLGCLEQSRQHVSSESRLTDTTESVLFETWNLRSF